MYNVITCDNVGSQFKYVKRMFRFFNYLFFPICYSLKREDLFKKVKIRQTCRFHIMYKNWLKGKLQKRVATFEHSKCSILHVAT